LIHASLHRKCSKKNLRHGQNIVTKIVADIAHAIDRSVPQNPFRMQPRSSRMHVPRGLFPEPMINIAAHPLDKPVVSDYKEAGRFGLADGANTVGTAETSGGAILLPAPFNSLIGWSVA